MRRVFIREKWKVIDYKDIKPNMYMISNTSKVKNIISGSYVNYNNPDNEKGYCRIPLRTVENKTKKFLLHRLVMIHFEPIYNINEIQVNHKNGKKTYNSHLNLEWMTDLENKRHARKTGLYGVYSRIDSKLVHKICKLLAKNYSPSDIIEKLGLKERDRQIIWNIMNKRSWVKISKNYDWGIERLRHPKYDIKDIELMCKYCGESKSINEITEIFSHKYEAKKVKNIIKKIRQKKLYRKISDKYFKIPITTVKSSTTIS